MPQHEPESNYLKRSLKRYIEHSESEKAIVARIIALASVTSEITKRYYVRRYVIATSVESLEYPASLLNSRNSRSRKKSYLALILDQGENDNFRETFSPTRSIRRKCVVTVDVLRTLDSAPTK